MSNQVSIPLKIARPIAIKETVHAYIHTNHEETHPDAFKWDIQRWGQLRTEATTGSVNISRINAALEYYAHLVFILKKLPPDIGLDIAYHSVFSPTDPPEVHRSIIYEKAVVLFNIASLYSQLAYSEDRSHADGIKRANVYYQNAAGTLAYLTDSTLPSLKESLPDQLLPADLSESFLKTLEYVMLAQAQECAWQRAVMGQFKNGVVAKLSAKAAALYRSAVTTIQDAPANVRKAFSAAWLIHIETKQHHFEAAAQYRKSMDDLEANRYGHELARLLQAETISKRGCDVARRGLAAKPVLDDIRSLHEVVQKSIKRSERDNDLIYHHDVPAGSTLPPIQEAAVVQSSIPPGLQDPSSLINETPLFQDLVGWGARVAVELYQDRRKKWIDAEIHQRTRELDDCATRTLQSLNLPSSLEALDKPIGLPPSLLKKAEEVRLEDGPERVDASINDIEMLSDRNRILLNEAMDLLDQEASEDEGLRRDQKSFSRLPSYQANQELTSKEKRYRQILEQAAESDELVRQKWSEWEDTVLRLTWDESDLERWVPSSTTKGKSRNPQTEMHARALRVQLEALDDVRITRAQLVQRAQRLAEADDIKPRILREASAMERWAKVEPAMFEETIEQELNKYEKFKDGIEAGASKQAEILENITSSNQLFLQSRLDDQSVKDREYALQSLDLAYHKYKEINRNLDEGLKFYNDLANILTMFREACKAWVRSRRDEISVLSASHALGNSHLDDEQYDTDPVSPPPIRAKLGNAMPASASSVVGAHAASSRSRKATLELPPPGSDEWEETPVLHASTRSRKATLGLPPPLDSDEWETMPVQSRK